MMKPFARPMVARDPDEHHRAATPLELLFDLASVIAIAAAAAGLHHAIADAHAWDGIVRFLLAFFAIWWAWMNYTWFASAYDNEDTLFRILSMVMIGGAVTMAAGVDPLFKSLDLSVIIIGYVVMRLPLVILW
ncbi:MAG: low temperature requirement protein A, partial [Litorimonas sp.]